MLQMSPVPGGHHRVFDSVKRQVFFVGPKYQAQYVLSRLQRAAKHSSFALRSTKNGTYVVVDLSGTNAKRIRREQVRYETFNMKRAERVLEAFLAGEI